MPRQQKKSRKSRKSSRKKRKKESSEEISQELATSSPALPRTMSAESKQEDSEAIVPTTQIVPAVTPIRIRKDVPKWARQVVSLRNEFPRDSEYQSIMALLRSKNMLSSTESTDEIVMISVPRSMSRRVVFAFTSEDGKLREVFEADRK